VSVADACVCVCVSVCMCERERERDRFGREKRVHLDRKWYFKCKNWFSRQYFRHERHETK
jgi:hypothetical protein